MVWQQKGVISTSLTRTVRVPPMLLSLSGVRANQGDQSSTGREEARPLP